MTQLDKKYVLNSSLLICRCVYTSEITDNGDEPAFVVTCWEDKDNPIIITRPTASGAWAEVGKRFFELKKVCKCERRTHFCRKSLEETQ